MIDFITVVSSQNFFTEIHGKVLPCNEVMNDRCHTGRHSQTGIQSGFVKGRGGASTPTGASPAHFCWLELACRKVRAQDTRCMNMSIREKDGNQQQD